MHLIINSYFKLVFVEIQGYRILNVINCNNL